MAAFLELPDNIWENDFFKKIIKNLVYVVFILYILMVFSFVSTDDNALDTKKNTLYLVGIILPLVAFAYFIFSNVEDKKYFLLLLVMAAILIIVLLRTMLPSFDTFLRELGYSFLDYTQLSPLSKDTSFIVTIFSKLLLICIALVFLSILFNVAFNESFRQRGKMGILLYALFYIPCLITDYVKYLFGELRTTPVVVYALLFIEAALIALYFLLPKLISKIVFKKSNRIQKEPMFLYNKKEIADATPFYNVTPEYKDLAKTHNISGVPASETDAGAEADDIPNKSLLRNYSLSLWVTLNNPNMASEEEAMIFRVGEDLGTLAEPDYPQWGAPYIACKGHGKWKFVLSNNVLDGSGVLIPENLEKASVEMELPFQRWNYLVFNYHDNQADIFVNGELTDTIPLGEILPIYSHGMKVNIGTDTHRLHGAVCEVRVHTELLGQTQIAQSYNMLKMKNPPVNNLP